MENKRAVIVLHGVGDQDNEGIELKGSGRMTATDPGCVKTRKWPPEIGFKPFKFSDEASHLLIGRYRLQG